MPASNLSPAIGHGAFRRSGGPDVLIAGVAKKLPLGCPTTQDATVATANIVLGFSDEASKVPSFRGILPFDSGDGPKVTIEHDAGDLTPGGTVTKAIQNPQHENEAMAMKS